MRSNPTCQHTPTRGYQGTVSIHGSLGTGAFSNSPALYDSLTSPRTLSGPPPPVLHMVLGTPSPYPCRSSPLVKVGLSAFETIQDPSQVSMPRPDTCRRDRKRYPSSPLPKQAPCMTPVSGNSRGGA